MSDVFEDQDGNRMDENSVKTLAVFDYLRSTANLVFLSSGKHPDKVMETIVGPVRGNRTSGKPTDRDLCALVQNAITELLKSAKIVKTDEYLNSFDEKGNRKTPDENS